MSLTHLLARARELAGLSQRGLARKAGVPPSTVHRIETGRISPTAEMLERLLAASNLEPIVILLPTVEDVLARSGLNESERRSLVMGVLAARSLLRDPVAAIALGRRNLAIMREAAAPRSNPYIDTWERLLEATTDEVLDVLTGSDQTARDLRQATPFAGLVPETERRTALQQLRAAA